MVLYLLCRSKCVRAAIWKTLVSATNSLFPTACHGQRRRIGDAIQLPTERFPLARPAKHDAHHHPQLLKSHRWLHQKHHVPCPASPLHQRQQLRKSVVPEWMLERFLAGQCPKKIVHGMAEGEPNRGFTNYG